MSKLYFKIGADFDKVMRLRDEIAKLRQELLSMNKFQAPNAVTELEVKLGAAKKEFDKLTIEASRAGAMMEYDFKKGINKGSQAVNDLTQNIITQRNEIGTMQITLRKNKDLYKTIVSKGGDDSVLLGRIRDQEKALWREKDALFKLTQEQATARLSVKKLRDEYAVFQNDGQKVVESNENMALSFKKTLAAIGGIAAIKQFASEVLKIRGQFQQLDVAFTTLLQSKEKANALMSQLVKTAAETPFNLTEVATGAKQLVAYGFASEQVNDTLIRLGNVAAGLGLPLERLTYLYGTTMTQGRLYARDLMQFTTSGIPMLQGLADMFGVTTQEVNEMITAGKVGFPEVQKVIENMTNEGGKFFNLMQEQSKTITGKISNLGDAWDLMLNKIGQSQEGVINGSLDMAKYLVENYEQVGKILVGLIATYGAYKTATITYYTITKTYGIYDIATKELQFVATMKNVTATKAMTIQQALLNKTMLANPYVLIATFVVGAAAAMWALHDSATAAEKAQSKFNDELDKFKQKEEERKQKIESLIRTIQDETETEFAKVKAYRELQRLSPALTAAYSREQLAILELAKSHKVLNAERDKINYENIISNVNRISNQIKSINEKISLGTNRGYFTQKKLNDNKEILEQELRKYQEALNSYNHLKDQAEENSKPIEIRLFEAKADLKQIQSEFDKAKKKLEEEQAKLKSNPFLAIPFQIQLEFNIAQDNLKNITGKISSLEGQKSNKTTYKKAYDDARKEWNVSKKALSDIERDKNKFTKEQYKAAKDRKDTAEKAFKDLGGITNTSKQDSASYSLRKEQEAIREQKDKNAQLDKKQSLDRQRQQQDLENQAAQAEIDALDDSFEKIDKQRKLNNKKEIQTLERQKKDYINAVIQFEKEKFDAEEELNAKQKKGYVKKTFDSSTVKVDTSSFDGIIGNTSKKQQNDKIREQEESWDEYLIKYGTFQQKKEAIDRKYQRLIKEAPDAGKAGDLQKEWEESIANLDLSKLKQEINWEMIFGDLSKVTKEQLAKIKDQLQEFKKSPEFQKATPENIQVIEGAINSINNAMVDKGGFFGGMIDSVNELKLATEELKKAEEELAEANKNGTDAQKEEAQKKVNKAQNRQQNADTNVKKSSDKTIDHLIAVGDAIAQLGSTAEMTLSSFGDATGSIIDAFTEAGSKVGGIVGAIFSILDGIQSQGFDKFVGNILESVAGAALSAATFGLVKIGADYSEYNEMKDQYESISSLWDELIEKKTEYLELGTTQERQRTEEEILELIKKQEEEARKLGRERLNSGASAGSHSIGVRQKDKYISEKGWNEAKKVLGSDFDKIKSGRMEGLFDLTIEQLKQLKENAYDFWQSLDEDVRQYLENIIECGKQTEEAIEKSKELWTGISFDSLVDNFKSALSDMDSSAEDFVDDFQGYLMNAMIDSFVNGKEFKDKLRSWYDLYYDFIKNDGKIDLIEKDELKQGWDIMVQEGLDFRNNLKEAMGWDSGSYSQTATSKGFQAMSQDTGDELNGRFTALQMASEEIKNESIKQTELLSSINGKMSIRDMTSTDVRALLSQSSPGIAGQARAIATASIQQVNVVFPTDELKILADKMSNMESIVDEIRTTQTIGWGNVDEMTGGISKMTKNIPAMNGKLDDINSNIKKAL